MVDRIEELRSRLYGLVLDARREAAVALLSAEAEGSGYRFAISSVLSPTLGLIGERWHSDSISLAQAYVAGKVAEDVLQLLTESEERAGNLSAPFRGRTIVCNAEDDYHSLGRRMLATFLRIEGWEVIDLGNDVLAADLIDEVERREVRVIGVSAMMLTNARNISRVRDEIEARGLGGRVKLAVGGAVFVMRPEMVAEVGGDGTATTAMEAPALFESLAALVGRAEQ